MYSNSEEAFIDSLRAEATRGSAHGHRGATTPTYRVTIESERSMHVAYSAIAKRDPHLREADFVPRGISQKLYRSSYLWQSRPSIVASELDPGVKDFVMVRFAVHGPGAQESEMKVDDAEEMLASELDCRLATCREGAEYARSDLEALRNQPWVAVLGSSTSDRDDAYAMVFGGRIADDGLIDGKSTVEPIFDACSYTRKFPIGFRVLAVRRAKRSVDT